MFGLGFSLLAPSHLVCRFQVPASPPTCTGICHWFSCGKVFSYEKQILLANDSKGYPMLNHLMSKCSTGHHSLVQ